MESEPVAETTPAWRLGEMHHLGLTVADIDRSIRFYRDILGLTLQRLRPRVDAGYVAQQTGYSGVVLSVASFRISAAQSLEVAQYLKQGGPPAQTATNRPGVSHLCLTVSDLWACYTDLTAKGVRFRSEPVTITSGPNAGGLVAYFFDPDGYALELFQLPDGPADRQLARGEESSHGRAV